MVVSKQIFHELDPYWFEPEYPSPELRANKPMIPFAKVLIADDMPTIKSFVESFTQKKPRDVNKISRFHTLRRQIKSALRPMSLKVRYRVRTLEKRADERLKKALKEEQNS
jgi:hypothetical protein